MSNKEKNRMEKIRGKTEILIVCCLHEEFFYQSTLEHVRVSSILVLVRFGLRCAKKCNNISGIYSIKHYIGTAKWT